MNPHSGYLNPAHNLRSRSSTSHPRASAVDEECMSPPLATQENQLERFVILADWIKPRRSGSKVCLLSSKETLNIPSKRNIAPSYGSAFSSSLRNNKF